MNLDATDMGALIAVLVMALVTLATRWGGVYAMSLIPISSRVRRFIQAMLGSVLVALLTPMAVTGDTGARLALLTRSDERRVGNEGGSTCRTGGSPYP